MKLIVAVLRKEDEADTIAELNKKGFFVTELATTGGFGKQLPMRPPRWKAETSARAEIALFRLIPRQEAVLCLC